jgi:hypothetical protein
MLDLEIEFDETMPPHAVFLTTDLSGATLRVKLSPRVEAAVLLGLDGDVRDRIVEEVDRLQLGSA